VIFCLLFIFASVADTDKDGDVVDCHLPNYEQHSAVLAEQNDSSPKPLGRVTNKDKRVVSR
jgi:hypothetical protein